MNRCQDSALTHGILAFSRNIQANVHCSLRSGFEAQGTAKGRKGDTFRTSNRVKHTMPATRKVRQTICDDACIKSRFAMEFRRLTMYSYCIEGQGLTASYITFLPII